MWWTAVVLATAVGVLGIGWAVVAACGLALAPAAPWIVGAGLALGLPALAVRLVRECRARPRDGRLATVDRVLAFVLLVAGTLLALSAGAALLPPPLANLGFLGTLGCGAFLLVLVPVSVLVTWLRAAAPRQTGLATDRLVLAAQAWAVLLAVVALASGALGGLAAAVHRLGA